MKRYYFMLLTLVLIQIHVSGQLVIDYSTLSIDSVDKKKIKVGEFISVGIRNYDPDKDTKFEVEITGEQYENTSGIDAFKKKTAIKSADKINEDLYYILSLQVPDKDKSIIKIIRFDTSGTKKLEERSYFFRNRGGLKFDVSSGFFVTRLRDASYVLKSVSDTTKQVIAENNGGIRAGIGLLAHLHCRSQKLLSGGLTGGFEVNNDAKIGFLGGLSVFIGYDRKFIISAGGVFSKVKSISNLYCEGELVPNSVNEVPTVEIWKAGLFGALTYNF